jgi:adenosylmethionine-8-amino-7-oxononanoate aminotransferase
METPHSAVLHRDLHEVPDRIVAAQGKYLTLEDGRRVFDGSSGAAVSCIGHSDKRVLSAMAEQAGSLTYGCSMFFSTPPAEGLADFLVNSTGGQMAKAFIVSSGKQRLGSESAFRRSYPRLFP